MANNVVSPNIYELQQRVEELRKRLHLLDANHHDDSHVEYQKLDEKKSKAKEAILKQLQLAVQSEKDARAEAKIIIRFPRHISMNGDFTLELSGDGLTWSVLKDRACVMFGRNPDETLIVQIKNGQRVLVPLWTEIKPGQTIYAEILSKPLVQAKIRGLRHQDLSSSQAYMRRNSSSQNFAQPAVHFAGAPTEPEPNLKLVRRETVLELFLQVAIFVLLAVGIINPTNTSAAARWYEQLLAMPGHATFVTLRSGTSTEVSFTGNVTSMSEAWDWIEGPLSRFLNTNVSSTGFPIDSPSWWGFSSPDVCPPASANAEVDMAPLCARTNFSIATSANRSRWLTSSISSEVMGSVRLRQFRVRPNSCHNTNRQILSSCFDDYGSKSRTTQSYGPGDCGFEWRSEQELAADRPGAPPVQGALALYDSSGFVLDVPSAAQWPMALTFLKANEWVDEATKGIIVEFTMRNPNEDLFASVRALIEKDKVGAVRTRYDVNAMTIPQNGCPQCDVRFITDIIALILVLVTVIRALMGGFFYKARFQMWRTYDLAFAIIFLASFIVDMVMLGDYARWQDTYNPATTQYKSMDSAHNSFLIANRFRAAIIVMITLRFLVQGAFSLSRLTTLVFTRLLCVYILLGILLVPVVCAMTLLVMVLEQGSPVQVVTFGAALRDIFLIVTGVTDRLTAATPKIVRQTGWSIVFYLFLITFTWVLVVPTLIAWAVVAYERAVDMKNKRLKSTKKLASPPSNVQPPLPKPEQSSPTVHREDEKFDKALDATFPTPVHMQRVMSDTAYDPLVDKSAVQVLFEGTSDFSKGIWDKTFAKLPFRRNKPSNQSSPSV